MHLARAHPDPDIPRPLRSRRPWTHVILAAGLAVVLLACPRSAAAQPGPGLVYFAVEDLETQRVALRGTALGTGDALSRLNLAPNRLHRLWVLEAASLRVGRVTFTSAAAGQSTTIPAFSLQARFTHDDDDDGLPDLAEFIVGTDAKDPDTDGDGLPDGAEVLQGLDPLGNRAVRTGVIGTADTPGTALHVAAFNDIAVVADGDRGISVFNIFNTMNPVVIAQVDTPGTATATALAGNLIAVADGLAGLAVVDVADPPAAQLIHQLPFGVSAQTVAVAGQSAYVGLDNGRLLAVDMPTGLVLDQLTLPQSVDDLAIAGDALLVLTRGSLHLYDLRSTGLQPLGNVPVSGSVAPLEVGRKLFAGGGLAYVGHFTGYSVVDISNPATPQVVGVPPSTQLAVHDLAANGSGLLLAVTSSGGSQTLMLSPYDASDPTDVTRIITSLDTPGDARAVAIYNGLAYVADTQAGLQVVNYLAFDTLRQPPTISLATSEPSLIAEEGQRFRVTAQVNDDVQVRNVEFYLDNLRLATDGNFPFELHFRTPLITPQKSTFTLRARASDTGGNATFTPTMVFTLRPDSSPPLVRQTFPANGAILGSLNTLDTLAAYFNEPLDTNTLGSAAFRLFSAGADDLLGTADDTPVTGGTLSYRDSLNAAFLRLATGLGPGLYRAVVGPPLADARGNVMSQEVRWSFRLLPFTDTDGDGLPDDLEPLLGLDPLNPDSNGNGIDDGREDFDQDGLPNVGEVLLDTDPQVADSDGNGLNDGLEDRDQDGLNDGQELARGTNPFAVDTDLDGWPDEAEVLTGSDPLDADSTPSLFVGGAPVALLTTLGPVDSHGSGSVAIAGAPPLTTTLLGLPDSHDDGSSVTAAQPPVRVTFE